VPAGFKLAISILGLNIECPYDVVQESILLISFGQIVFRQNSVILEIKYKILPKKCRQKFNVKLFHSAAL
jgi:hypothetical protein